MEQHRTWLIFSTHESRSLVVLLRRARLHSVQTMKHVRSSNGLAITLASPPHSQWVFIYVQPESASRRQRGATFGRETSPQYARSQYRPHHGLNMHPNLGFRPQRSRPTSTACRLWLELRLSVATSGCGPSAQGFLGC